MNCFSYFRMCNVTTFTTVYTLVAGNELLFLFLFPSISLSLWPLPIFQKPKTDSILLQTYGNVSAWPVSYCINNTCIVIGLERAFFYKPLAILHYKPPVLSSTSFLLAQVRMFIFQFYAMRIIV